MLKRVLIAAAALHNLHSIGDSHYALHDAGSKRGTAGTALFFAAMEYLTAESAPAAGVGGGAALATRSRSATVLSPEARMCRRRCFPNREK